MQQLWARLGIDQILREEAEGRKFGMDVERALFALVASRALTPRSKLAVERWIEEEVALPDIETLPVHHLYRAINFPLEVSPSVEKRVYHAVADLFNLAVNLLYFDTTSVYFDVEETPEDDVLRRRGLIKDHRPDRPQAVIGLAVTREGLPVR